MTQKERDRLVVLRKAERKLITQRQAAVELGMTERHVRRLLGKLRREGDRAVIHGLRGKPSNRRLSEAAGAEIVAILSAPVYEGFGPTLAAEYLAKEHGIEVGRETLRGLMIRAKLWRAKPRKPEKVHVWRPRRSRFGELVQWDTSTHDWLEGRGPQIKLIRMIDDATSRTLLRFVERDSSEENLAMLGRWLQRWGRMVGCYTDQASLFQTATKSRRDRPGERLEAHELPPTQIGRALRELQIAWIPAHSPQAKGRVERGFGTDQDRLVKGLRVAGVRTLEEANAYLEQEYLPWWEEHCTVKPAHPDDAHRSLEGYDLESILSLVEERTVGHDYTVRYRRGIYQIDRREIVPGLRGARVRVERRRDGSLAIAFQGRFLRFRQCPAPARAEPGTETDKEAPAPRPAVRKPARSRWMKGFDLKKGPPVWKAAQAPG